MSRRSTHRSTDPAWIHHLRTESLQRLADDLPELRDPAEGPLSEEEVLLLSQAALPSDLNDFSPSAGGATFEQCFGKLSDEEFLRGTLRLPRNAWSGGWGSEVH